MRVDASHFNLSLIPMQFYANHCKFGPESMRIDAHRCIQSEINANRRDLFEFAVNRYDFL